MGIAATVQPEHLGVPRDATASKPLQLGTVRWTANPDALLPQHSKVAVDLLAGTIAGTAQLLVGHPFDTVKVKLQSQPAGSAAAFKGPLDAARQTVAAEGVRGIYKGMGAPLATVALFNAVLFASKGQMNALLAHVDGSPLTMSEQMVAAVGASAAVSIVATPTELLKCRLQAQGCASTAIARLAATGIDPRTVKVYRGPLDVARHVLAHERGLRGLYKGSSATLARESVGNVAMFGTYEYTKQALAERRGLASTADLPTRDVMMAGGLGGTAMWLVVYPLDIIKSKLQIDSFASPRYRGMWDCARQVVAAEGVRGLYRGYVPALVRGFPANAVCFGVYEAVQAGISPRSGST